MFSDEKQLDGPEDEAFTTLLRNALPEENPDFVRPSDDVVDAFVLRTATPAQREEMLKALSLSASFRSEVLELSREIAAVASPEARRRFDAAETDRESAKQIVSLALPERRAVVRPGPLERLRSLVWQPAFAYAIAALALIVPFALERQAPAPRVAIGSLLDLHSSRDAPGTDNPPDVTSPFDATALLVPLQLPETVTAADRPRQVRIERQDGQTVATITTPAESTVCAYNGCVLLLMLDAARFEDGTVYRLILDDETALSPDSPTTSVEFRFVRSPRRQ